MQNKQVKFGIYRIQPFGHNYNKLGKEKGKKHDYHALTQLIWLFLDSVEKMSMVRAKICFDIIDKYKIKKNTQHSNLVSESLGIDVSLYLYLNFMYII